MTAGYQTKTSSTRHSQGDSSSPHWWLRGAFLLHPHHSQQPSKSQLEASGAGDDSYSTLQECRKTRRLQSTTPVSYRAHFLRQGTDHLQQILDHALGAYCILFGGCLRSIFRQTAVCLSCCTAVQGWRRVVLWLGLKMRGSVEQAFQRL